MSEDSARWNHSRIPWLCVALVLVLAVFVAVPSSADAHPGGTDGNGCHRCRTNCTESWGIPYGYYHRHHPVRDCFEPPPTTQPPATTTTRPTTTTSQQTTTTRAPPQLEGDTVSEQLRKVRQEVLGFSSVLINVNQLWESGEASFTETHSSFLQVAADVSELRQALESQPSHRDDEDALESLAEALSDLEVAAANVIAGLEAPDSGQARAEAINEWLLVVAAFDSLVSELTLTATSTTTAVATATTTSIEVATTVASIPTAVEADASTEDDSGWILLVALVGGLAYWMGRRRGPSS